jgi:hypothetical protein
MIPISEVLEEAARVCDAHAVDDTLVGVGIAQSCASMIRALAAKYGDAILCEPEPSAWVVIDAAGYVSLFDDEGTAHEYAEFAHGPRPVHKLYRAKEPK